MIAVLYVKRLQRNIKFSTFSTNLCIEVPALCNDNILWIHLKCSNKMKASDWSPTFQNKKFGGSTVCCHYTARGQGNSLVIPRFCWILCVVTFVETGFMLLWPRSQVGTFSDTGCAGTSIRKLVEGVGNSYICSCCVKDFKASATLRPRPDQWQCQP